MWFKFPLQAGTGTAEHHHTRRVAKLAAAASASGTAATGTAATGTATGNTVAPPAAPAPPPVATGTGCASATGSATRQWHWHRQPASERRAAARAPATRGPVSADVGVVTRTPPAAGALPAGTQAASVGPPLRAGSLAGRQRRNDAARAARGLPPLQYTSDRIRHCNTMGFDSVPSDVLSLHVSSKNQERGAWLVRLGYRARVPS